MYMTMYMTMSMFMCMRMRTNPECTPPPQRHELLLGDACTDEASCAIAEEHGVIASLVLSMDAYPHFAELHECAVWVLRQPQPLREVRHQTIADLVCGQGCHRSAALLGACRIGGELRQAGEQCRHRAVLDHGTRR